PGFAIIEHKGRRSGRSYRTPVNAFRRGERLSIALTYGAEGDWVKNVLATGGCSATVQRRELTLREPVIVLDEGRRAAPGPVRVVLRAMGVAEFLELMIVERDDDG